MWARFTVLSDTPVTSAIAGCVIPLSRSNTIWMRWRCSGCPFQRSAVFKRRIWLLVHLTICSSESDHRWSQRIILRFTNANSSRLRCFATVNIRFNLSWRRYESIPFKALTQNGEDLLGIEEVLERQQGIVSEADKGT